MSAVFLIFVFLFILLLTIGFSVTEHLLSSLQANLRLSLRFVLLELMTFGATLARLGCEGSAGIYSFAVFDTTRRRNCAGNHVSRAKYPI